MNKKDKAARLFDICVNLTEKAELSQNQLHILNQTVKGKLPILKADAIKEFQMKGEGNET